MITRDASFTSQNSSFEPVAGSRMPSPGVTSAAEAVVGIAMTGSFGACRIFGKNWSGGTKREACSSIDPPSARRIAIALAVSEALPPPTATSASMPSSPASVAPSLTTVVAECSTTRSKIAAQRGPSASRTDCSKRLRRVVAAADDQCAFRAQRLQLAAQQLDGVPRHHTALQGRVDLVAGDRHVTSEFLIRKLCFLLASNVPPKAILVNARVIRRVNAVRWSGPPPNG